MGTEGFPLPHADLWVDPLDGVERPLRQLGQLRVSDGVHRGGPLLVRERLHLGRTRDVGYQLICAMQCSMNQMQCSGSFMNQMQCSGASPL